MALFPSHIIVWLLASIFYAYQYILRVAPNILISDISQRYQVSAQALGQFSGLYYVGYALMHIPVGLLLDRLGPKRVLPACIVLTVLGMIPLIYSDTWVYPLWGRALTGMGSSAAILGLLQIIRFSFPARIFARMLSWSLIIGLLGAIYGGQPLQVLNQRFGYLVVLKGLALLGLALAALTAIMIPSHAPKTKTTSIGLELKSLLQNWKLLSLCLLAGLMVGPLEGFADVWASVFLIQVYKIAPEQAAFLPSVIFIGMSFGGQLLSFIAEKTGRYCALIFLSALLMSGLFFGLIQLWFSSHTIGLVFALIGIFSAYQVLVMYKATTYVPLDQLSLSSALTNMIVMLFGYVFHSSIGYLVARNTTTLSPEGYASASAYLTGIMPIPIALALAALGLVIFIRHYHES